MRLCFRILFAEASTFKCLSFIVHRSFKIMKTKESIGCYDSFKNDPNCPPYETIIMDYMEKAQTSFLINDTVIGSMIH